MRLPVNLEKELNEPSDNQIESTAYLAEDLSKLKPAISG